MSSSLLDKLLLFIFCATLFLSERPDKYAVVYILLALTAASAVSWFDRETISVSALAAIIAVSLFFPETSFFLPLFTYDIFHTRYRWSAILSVLPVFSILRDREPYTVFFLILIILLSGLLRRRSMNAAQKQHEYNLLRDEITEKQMQLERANKELLEKQDYEIHLATLRERNRISGELHDSIGHVLTSSLLQTGALLAISRDESEKEGLSVLQKSLSAGMDEVRTAIHNMHDDSFDLYSEVRARIGDFLFCPIKLRYQIEIKPGKNIQYAFLSILKEGLANIARHSNATEAVVILKEHPAFYQLIIRDNGTGAKPASSPESETAGGMGIPGIRKRVAALGGQVHISRRNGFEIFVSVPKEIL